MTDFNQDRNRMRTMVVVAAVVVATAIGLVIWTQNDDPDTLGEAIEQGADDISDGLKDAGDELDDAADKIKDPD